MSREFEVVVSGEGDFEMTTDCAWKVGIVTHEYISTITVKVEDGQPIIDVNGKEIWREDS